MTVVPETETTDHYFLRYPFFATSRQKLLNDLFKVDPSLRNLKDDLLLDIILYGSDKYNDTGVKEILLHTFNFIKNTKRFQRPLFDHKSTFTFIIIIKKFNLKHCLLPITSFLTDFLSIYHSR